MKTRWCIESGPDNSHLFDCAWRDTLREAREYVKNLPLTPGGQLRPYKITRYRYESVSRQWERIVDVSVVESAYMMPAPH